MSAADISGVPSPLGEKDRMRGDSVKHPTGLAITLRGANAGVLQDPAYGAGADSPNRGAARTLFRGRTWNIGGWELIFRLLDCSIKPIFAGEFLALAEARCYLSVSLRHISR